MLDGYANDFSGDELVRWEVNDTMAKIRGSAAEAENILFGLEQLHAEREGLAVGEDRPPARIRIGGEGMGGGQRLGAEARGVLEAMDADMVRHLCHETELQQVRPPSLSALFREGG